MSTRATDPSPEIRTPVTVVLGNAGPSFLTLDVLARLPAAMFPLGVLLLVADRTDSYGAGGLAVAALSVGGGLGGPLVGLLADRWGQRPVALGATALQVSALAALLLGTDLTTAPLLAVVGLVGLANPQMGAMARARWAAYARSREDRRSFVSSAMAFESALDEVSFVLGPVVVGTLAAVVSPTAALALALGLALVAQSGFGLHRSALPGRAPVGADDVVPAAPLPVAHLVTLLVAMGSIGVVFGVTQTGVAAQLQLTGQDSLTGLVYGLMGVGSAVTALLTTRLPVRVSHELRIAVAGAMLVVAGLAVAAATTPTLLGGANLLLGVALAPALVSGYALAERAAPEGRGTTMMTALATANVVGVAVGAATAGQLVDGAGPTAAFLVNCLAGALVLAAGLTVLVRRAR